MRFSLRDSAEGPGAVFGRALFIKGARNWTSFLTVSTLEDVRVGFIGARLGCVLAFGVLGLGSGVRFTVEDVVSIAGITKPSDF